MYPVNNCFAIFWSDEPCFRDNLITTFPSCLGTMLSVCLSVCRSVCLSVGLFCMSVCVSICLSVLLYVFLTCLCRPAYLLSICPIACLTLSFQKYSWFPSFLQYKSTGLPISNHYNVTYLYKGRSKIPSPGNQLFFLFRWVHSYKDGSVYINLCLTTLYGQCCTLGCTAALA